MFRGRKIIVDVEKGKPKSGFRYRPKEDLKKYNKDMEEVKMRKMKKIRKDKKFNKEDIKNLTYKKDQKEFEKKVDNLNIFK